MLMPFFPVGQHDDLQEAFPETVIQAPVTIDLEYVTQNLKKSYRIKQKNSFRKLNMIKQAKNMNDEDFETKVGKIYKHIIDGDEVAINLHKKQEKEENEEDIEDIISKKNFIGELTDDEAAEIQKDLINDILSFL